TALFRNILWAVNYDYPGILFPLMFVIDNTTLILHEGGHSIFGLFGWRFLGVAGGTLMQLLIPFAIFISAWLKNQKTIAQFFLFWLGFSWMDTAAYCMDARFQQLPLIGNLPKSAHDFTNLMNMTGLMDHYIFIAWTFFFIGFLILILSLLWPGFYQQKQSGYIDLETELEKAGLDT
ncbi:MAG: hypothetical protein MI700_05755, partial [Balneolales bacterium]|nr:hypothetical protein [Balneolales bacterium]